MQKNAFLAVLAFLLFLCRFSVGEQKTWLDSEDRKRIESVIERLQFCATTDQEVRHVQEIRLRCEAMLLLRGAGVDFRKALAFLAKRGETGIIVQGLGHQNVQARIDVAKALARLGSPEAVPYLLQALRQHPPGWQLGSSDSYGGFIALRRELVKALEKLTGQKFGVTDTEDQEQLNKVIQATEKWLNDRKDLPTDKSQ